MSLHVRSEATKQLRKTYLNGAEHLTQLVAPNTRKLDPNIKNSNRTVLKREHFCMLGRNNKGMRTRIHVKLHLHLWREWIRKKDASINRKKTCSPFNCASLFKRGRGLRGLTAPKESRCCLRNHSCCIFAKKCFNCNTLRLVSERSSSSEFFLSV